MKTILVSVLIAGTGMLASPVFAAPLPNAKAPLKNTVQLKPYKGKMTFDPKNQTYTYGDKQLVVHQDSTFSVFSGGREFSKTRLYIATYYKGKSNIKSPKVDDSYRGYAMNIRNVSLQGNALIFTGKIPWDKPGNPYINGSWKLSYTPKTDTQITVRFQYAPPEGHKHIDYGIFMNFQNIKSIDAGKHGRWKYGQKFPAHVRKGSSDIRIECPDPKDNHTIHTRGRWNNFHSPSLRFQLDKSSDYAVSREMVCEFTIDLSNSYVRKTVKAPGGVDLLATDLLHVPERGKNKFPNPYIAEKLMFFEPYDVMSSKRNTSLSTDAKFGRYSLKGSAVSIPAVPLDAGDYVLSFYVKGKGGIWCRFTSAGAGFMKIFSKQINSPDKWTRVEMPFHFPSNNAFRGQIHSGMLLDGFQLEKGKKATAFEAPAITAGPDGDFFFEHNANIKLPFEFSTLEKSVAVNGVMTVKNFFGEQVYRKNFKLDLTAGTYPKMTFAPGKLPDGLYVVKMDYGKAAPAQYFRFPVMPFLKNTHATAKAFSLGYYGHVLTLRDINEKYLERLQKIGVGADGHSVPMTKEVLDKYAKYKVIPFDVGYGGRRESLAMEKAFPELKNVPRGHTWSLLYDNDVRDPATHWHKGLLPDYRLAGGWNKEYRDKVVKIIQEQVRRYPQRKAYRFASEWAHEIKDDPHYPDFYAAYYEAVKSVYPTAWVYEAGEPNMDVDGGTAYYNKTLNSLKGKAKTDLVGIHTYTKRFPELYNNFRMFVKMVDSHKELGPRIPIALAEGMHFYPYSVAAWNTELIGWNGECWMGGILSYDLGWTEKISAAYFARAWLIFLTEYDRLWAACCSSYNNRNFAMDDYLTPRAMQKIPNTIGVLLGNPKAYLGDFTFAPETRCLVWEDEKGRPIAAVWNETESVDSGMQDAPMAKINYKGAEYIDLMGMARKPAVDGEFAVSPFPLFIRGRAGDSKAFTKALATAIFADPNKLPCSLSFSLQSADTVKLNLNNPLARDLAGTLNIFEKKHPFKVAGNSTANILLKLPKPVQYGKIETLRIPYTCTIQGYTVTNEYVIHCAMVPEFKGDWDTIPSVKLTNYCGQKMKKIPSAKDFSASYQLAWTPKNLLLRVKVKDNIFAPGRGTGYRWNNDFLQIFIDTRCSAMKTGSKRYDEDDYEYGIMPTADGKHCEVWRARSPDIQLTLGIAAPKNNMIAKQIPAKFTRTADGYIYEVKFPADYILPIRLEKGYHFAFGLYAADRDNGKNVLQGVSNATKPQSSGYGKPQLWPVMILTD